MEKAKTSNKNSFRVNIPSHDYERYLDSCQSLHSCQCPVCEEDISFETQEQYQDHLDGCTVQKRQKSYNSVNITYREITGCCPHCYLTMTFRDYKAFEGHMAKCTWDQGDPVSFIPCKTKVPIISPQAFYEKAYWNYVNCPPESSIFEIEKRFDVMVDAIVPGVVHVSDKKTEVARAYKIRPLIVATIVFSLIMILTFLGL